MQRGKNQSISWPDDVGGNLNQDLAVASEFSVIVRQGVFCAIFGFLSAKFDFLLWLGVHLPVWGALTTFPYKLRPIFLRPGGVRARSAPPLATPMLVTVSFMHP